MQNLTEICNGINQETYYLNGQRKVVYCLLQGIQDCLYQQRKKMHILNKDGVKKRYHLCYYGLETTTSFPDDDY